MSLAKDLKVKTDDILTRFLLGELSEKERVEIEERFLSDNEFFEEILSAEDALRDQYLLGLLSDEERTRAKTLLESGREQRRNLEFNRELIALVREAGLSQTKTPSPAVPISAGLLRSMPRVRAAVWLGLIGILLASWIIYLHLKERRVEVRLVAAEQSNRETTDKLKQEVERSQNLTQQLEWEREEGRKREELLAQLQSAQPARVTSILLAPATFERSGESKVVSINVKIERIRLQLALDEIPGYDRYSLQITTFGGRKIWNSNSLRANQIRDGRLEVILPNSLFGYEDYKLELRGLSDSGEFLHLADYAFKVRR